MKKTGPSKQSTRGLIVSLEKRGKRSGQRIWLDLAKRLAKPSRNRTRINLWKLGRLGKKFNGKILVVPGKVLGTGPAEKGMKVAAFEFSMSARDKIGGAGGEAILLATLVGREPKPDAMVIVSG